MAHEEYDSVPSPSYQSSKRALPADSDDDEIPLPPPAKKAKGKQKQIIESDSEGEGHLKPPSPRGKRLRVPTAKQREINETSEQSKDQIIAQLLARNSRLKQKNASLSEQHEQQEEFESEDELEGVPKMSLFPAPAVVRSVIPQPEPTLVRRPRKSTKAVDAPLPAAPPSSSSSSSVPASSSAVQDGFGGWDYPPQPSPTQSGFSSPPRIQIHIPSLDASLNPRKASSSSSSRSASSASSAKASSSKSLTYLSSSSSSRSGSTPVSSMGETASTLPPTQPTFKDGTEPKSRPALNDYKDISKRLIENAMHEFSARILTVNASPTEIMAEIWVCEIWLKCNKALECNQVLTERIKTIIKARCSHTRSFAISRIRPLVGPFFGFIQTSHTTAVQIHNLELFKKLTEQDQVILYSDYKNLKGYMKNDLISQALRALAFKTLKFIGVVYEDYFNPIPLPLLALVFAIMKFCVHEFSSGFHEPAVFSESSVEENVAAYLTILNEWRNIKPDAVDRILKKMHDNLRASTGAQLTRTTAALSDDAKAAALKELEEGSDVGEEVIVDDV